MTIKEKLALLEDTFEIEEGELKEDSKLSELEEWDSMTKLSLIVLMEDEFGKKITGEQIKSFITVKDILDFME
ncbi:phosphopantetheine-binding protein [Heyndrickxia sporothermodurans]|uniref:acyl carrier protein n=1 Tax=Heyndrickxia sporothermodurans TaxID=46224 RepID=UPI002E1B525B|nr:phosphopantetheine-binding protein [Heyndrickxia sporothermodurans]